MQPVGALGNAPRTNGDVRTFWNLNENISLAKSNKLGNNLKVDLRLEVFNVFNRVVFGVGVNSVYEHRHTHQEGDDAADCRLPIRG